MPPSGVPGFLLMPDRKDRHSIIVDMVSNDITAVAKVDEPFPKLFGKVIHHPTKARLCTEYPHPLPDRLTGSTRSVRVLRTQEIPQPLQVPDRRRGEYHLWHSGADSSFSVPQLASH